MNDFIRSSKADVILLNADGELADTGSEWPMQPVQEEENVTVATDGSGDGKISASWDVSVSEDAQNTTTVVTLQQYSIIADVTFANRPEMYALYVTPHAQEENLAVRALIQMAPWLVLALLAFSLLCALVYSRYIPRPIVRISGIAKRMAKLDFNWKCSEQRHDEIGTLGRSLNQMSQPLSAALKELEAANCTLREEVERQRMPWPAASPEARLPCPFTGICFKI